MDAVVFAAADLAPTSRLRARLATLDRPFVVAADRGAETALAFGFQPDLLIGDFDSLSEATLARLRASGTPIESYPRDKDATDGALAIERALAVHPETLLLVGFLGGPRLDQALANLMLLLGTEPRAWLVDTHNEVTLARPGDVLSWHPEAGEIVSLLPLGSDAHGVSTSGLRWPLTDEVLRVGATRGVSNEPVANIVGVSLTGGALLVTRYFPAG